VVFDESVLTARGDWPLRIREARGRHYVTASRSTLYTGTALLPRTHYWFAVQLNGEYGKISGTGSASWFETGLLAQPSWPSWWLAAPVHSGDRAELYLTQVEVAGPLRVARAYLAGLVAW